MRPDFLDRHSRLHSPIHRLPPALKLIAALALVIATVLVPSSAWPFFSATAALLLVAAVISRIPPSFLLARLLLLEPLVLAVGILMLFQPNGRLVFLFFAIRSTLCLLTMLLLANTTGFSQLLRVLKAIHLPALLLTTLALMYRYLFVLFDEAQRMKRARLSRTFTAQPRRAWRASAAVIARLFVRASERAERIYLAMCARGWR